MVSLEKIQEMNKWWAKGINFQYEDYDLQRYSSSFVRLIRDGIESHMAPGKIMVIKGPRRAGKTIALKLAISRLLSGNMVDKDDIFYFSFELTMSAKEMETMIRDFLNRPHKGMTCIFLDEIQEVREWASVILGISNAGLLSNTWMAVTGSVAHRLEIETLPGRGTEGNRYLMRTASFRTFVLSLLGQAMVVSNSKSI